MKKLLLSITFLLFFALFLTSGWQIFFSSVSSIDEQRIFVIQKGDGLLEIARNLEEENLIKNGLMFKSYVFLKGSHNKIKAGGYFLSPSMTVAEIAEKIIAGDTGKIRIIIPEGFTLNQIEERLNLKFSFRNQKINIQNIKADDYKNDFLFLSDAPKNALLEGFLFPDTYFFDFSDEKEQIIKKILENFDKKLTFDLREKIKNQGKTIFEIITMASMIEREVRTLEDKKIVSGILWKRLDVGMPLQVDATIIYLTGRKSTIITMEELNIDSPYNTYKHRGLPIGPISNPGIKSILAAIYPQESEYWFYLSAPDGKTVFSKNYTDHSIAREKYLR